MNQASKAYRFTLTLKNVDANTPNLEDSLYEAGCQDALINSREGVVYLDFDRKAASLEEAVMSAIKDVEMSTIKAVVSNLAPESLVTETEVAKRLHIKRQAVSLWIKGQRRNAIPFPKPIMWLSNKSPFWKWSEIANWLYHNHLITEKEVVTNALFVEHMNAALEERDITARKYRHSLLKKIENLGRLD